MLTSAAQSAFGPELVSVVLYGTAADGTLRATSDVNLIVVLQSFQVEQANAFREPLRGAHAAFQADAMFLLASELPEAVESFAEKFADVMRRRRVLFGDDVFRGLAPQRATAILRLRQVLLNLILRLRHAYLERSLREEQASYAVADATGPLRSCAATLFELEGHPVATPKRALEELARRVPGKDWTEALGHLSAAREGKLLPPGVAPGLLFDLIELTRALRSRAEALS